MAENLANLDPSMLRPYRGRWIAVRRGVVVASAPTVGALLQRFAVVRTDTRMKVPR